jgi:hypothetical protein
VPKGKDKSGRLSVFKGREARLNRAIFHTLALKGPQTIYDIHKEVKAKTGLKYTRYATVHKRVRFLAESSYVKRIGFKKTKAGFEAFIYELTSKAYLAMLLNLVNLDNLLNQLDEATSSTILGDFINAQNLS